MTLLRNLFFTFTLLSSTAFGMIPNGDSSQETDPIDAVTAFLESMYLTDTPEDLKESIQQQLMRFTESQCRSLGNQMTGQGNYSLEALINSIQESIAQEANLIAQIKEATGRDDSSAAKALYLAKKQATIQLFAGMILNLYDQSRETAKTVLTQILQICSQDFDTVLPPAAQASFGMDCVSYMRKDFLEKQQIFADFQVEYASLITGISEGTIVSTVAPLTSVPTTEEALNMMLQPRAKEEIHKYLKEEFRTQKQDPKKTRFTGAKKVLKKNQTHTPRVAAHDSSSDDES